MVGLKETGEPDTETLWKMAQPRCGMPDEVPIGTGVSANSLTDPSRNPMNYYVPGIYMLLTHRRRKRNECSRCKFRFWKCRLAMRHCAKIN